MSKRSREASPPTASSVSHDANVRSVKVLAIDQTPTPDSNVMQCSLPPHKTSLDFDTLNAFEIHYAQEHTNRCSSCGKNLPSTHLLSLHLDEQHNPLREALASKGEKTYACFLEDCDKKCFSPQKRRLHMIDKHGFPKLYDFGVIHRGVDNTTSLLRDGRKRRVSLSTDQVFTNRSSVKTLPRSVAPVEEQTIPPISDNPSTELDENTDSFRAQTVVTTDTGKAELPDLEASFAAMHFVPRSVNPRTSQSTRQNHKKPLY